LISGASGINSASAELMGGLATIKCFLGASNFNGESITFRFLDFENANFLLALPCKSEFLLWKKCLKLRRADCFWNACFELIGVRWLISK